jgi:hypothetical protein
MTTNPEQAPDPGTDARAPGRAAALRHTTEPQTMGLRTIDLRSVGLPADVPPADPQVEAALEAEKVGSMERALRTDLADAVRFELAAAGLPVGDATASGFTGAQLEVDLGGDAAGGVFVTWRASRLDVEAANRSLIDGGFDDTSLRRTDGVATTMRDAMISILGAAGYDVRPSDDVMRPLALRVTGHAGDVPADRA